MIRERYKIMVRNRILILNILFTAFCLTIAALFLFAPSLLSSEKSSYCLTGAFISDRPTARELRAFEEDYGKKAFYILIFFDWEREIDRTVLDSIFAEGSMPVITWEPWYWEDKSGVSPEEVLLGEFDDYIKGFARSLKDQQRTIYLRFAHEMNGDWYPWSASTIGAENYKAMYRYIYELFCDVGADNVKWIFSVNWENIPHDNCYKDSYPGDRYVDIIGVDGYNWGTSKSWSNWMEFDEIFLDVCEELFALYGKKIIITEFS